MSTPAFCDETSIAEFGASLDRLGRSPHTTRNYASDLLIFVDWHGRPVPMGEYNGIAMDWLNAYRRIWKPRTSERRVSALRAFGRWNGITAPLDGYTTPTPARQIPHPIPEGIPGVLRLIEACGSNHEKRALIALLGLCGLRIAEALATTPKDIDLELMLLTVYGKGSKVRHVPLSTPALMEIAPAYLAAVRENRPTLLPWKDRHARATITRLGVRAGLKRTLSSHDLRATFATAAYEKTKDIRVVQELLGHGSVKTTELYTGVTLQNMRAAADLVGEA